MLQTIRAAAIPLGDRAEALRNFLLGKLCPDGGLAGRSGRSDLYYTLFGLESLLGLGGLDRPERTKSYLAGFAAGEKLDFVHLCCLARCRADLGIPLSDNDAMRMARQIESYRSGDGGFGVSQGAGHGSAYANMLAVGVLEDIGAPVPLRQPDRLIESLDALRTADGGYANELALPVGASAATAAAIVTRRQFRQSDDGGAIDWLLANASPEGGFPAVPGLAADMLSTAVATFALSLAGRLPRRIAAPCRDFVNSLWDARGSFRADRFDDTLDCEYAWYGLLALGSMEGPP